AKTADLFSLELAWMAEITLAIKNISLPRSALKKYRQRAKALPFFFDSHERRGRHLGQIELALDEPVVHLARRVLVADVFELVTVERHQPVDQGAIARVGIGAESNFGFDRHDSYLPYLHGIRRNSFSPRRTRRARSLGVKIIKTSCPSYYNSSNFARPAQIFRCLEYSNTGN